MDQPNQSPTGAGSRRPMPTAIIALIGFLCFAAGFIAKGFAGGGAGSGASQSTPDVRTLEGRLDNLTSAVFELRTSLEKGSGNAADSTRQGGAISVAPPAAPMPVSKLLTQAEKLRTDGKLQEAEIILTRALQTDRDDVGAWRALAAVQREMSATSLKERNLLQAAQTADRARTSVNGLKALSVDPAHNIDPSVVTDEDTSNTKAIAAVRDSIDNACKGYIASALNSRDEASRWYWKNNRWWVVDGLKHLKKVIEIGPWASEQTRMAANEAFSLLKRMVSTDEWNELLARAGFDPGSRDTLRKWGLD